MRLTVTAIIITGSLLFGAGRASASTFELYQGGEAVSGPCGTVVIRQFDSDIVDVLAGQNPGHGFGHAGSENDRDFAWSPGNRADFASSRVADLALTVGLGTTTGNAGVVDDGLGGPSTEGLAWPATSGDAFGTLMDISNCTSCSNGYNPALATLEFPINPLNITISPASFSGSTADEDYALVTDGHAGPSDASDSTPFALASDQVPVELTAVPEPATILLLGSALLATSVGIRRRRA